MDERVSYLEEYVETLRAQIEILRAEVNRLHRRVERSEAGDLSSLHSGTSYPAASASANGSVVAYSGVTAPSITAAPADTPPAVLSWAQREEICDRIGAWIRRALEGTHRGTSGRDQIPLASRIWIVAQDFEGHSFDTVQVHRTFSTCRPVVKRGADCGNSIFVGLPSEREGRRVCIAAGLRWPSP